MSAPSVLHPNDAWWLNNAQTSNSLLMSPHVFPQLAAAAAAIAAPSTSVAQTSHFSSSLLTLSQAQHQHERQLAVAATTSTYAPAYLVAAQPSTLNVAVAAQPQPLISPLQSLAVTSQVPAAIASTSSTAAATGAPYDAAAHLFSPQSLARYQMVAISPHSPVVSAALLATAQQQTKPDDLAHYLPPNGGGAVTVPSPSLASILTASPRIDLHALKPQRPNENERVATAAAAVAPASIPPTATSSAAITTRARSSAARAPKRAVCKREDAPKLAVRTASPNVVQEQNAKIVAPRAKKVISAPQSVSSAASTSTGKVSRRFTRRLTNRRASFEATSRSPPAHLERRKLGTRGANNNERWPTRRNKTIANVVATTASARSVSSLANSAARQLQLAIGRRKNAATCQRQRSIAASNATRSGRRRGRRLRGV